MGQEAGERLKEKTSVEGMAEVGCEGNVQMSQPVVVVLLEQTAACETGPSKRTDWPDREGQLRQELSLT